MVTCVPGFSRRFPVGGKFEVGQMVLREDEGLKLQKEARDVLIGIGTAGAEGRRRVGHFPARRYYVENAERGSGPGHGS